MDINNLHIGAEVFWTDPDEGFSSGVYKVVSICGEIISLKNESGSHLEAFAHELS